MGNLLNCALVQQFCWMWRTYIYFIHVTHNGVTFTYYLFLLISSLKIEFMM
jgi:hypothetical protein